MMLRLMRRARSLHISTYLRRTAWQFAMLSVVVLLCALNQKPVFAQINGWSQQQPIPHYLPDTLPPYLVADQTGKVYAFASQGRDEDDRGEAVIFSTWSEDDGWSEVVDILLSPLKEQARVMGVYLDSSGIIHLIFFGGDDGEANIYYTSAHASHADRAQEWAEPIVIGDRAITPNVAQIASDGKGVFVVVYSGNLEIGNGLYAVTSRDNGVSWSDAELIWSTYNVKEKAFDFDMLISSMGALHTVWSATNEQGQIVTGLYARKSSIYDGEWSEPTEFDQNRGLGIAIPELFEFQSEIFLLYNNGLDVETAPVQWFIRSANDGISWSRPIRPFPNHIGRNGHFSFVVDSNGALNVFFGQRIPKGIDGKFDLHGMWQSTWKSGQWDSLRAVVNGAYKDEIDDSFDPYDASAIVVRGNRLLVTWRTDPGRKQPGVWFATKAIEGPRLPVVALATAIPTMTPAPVQPTATSTPVATPTSVAQSETGGSVAPTNASVANSQPGNALLIGVIPVGLLILLTLLLRGRARNASKMRGF